MCPHCGDCCGVGDLLASVEIVTRWTHPVTVTEQGLYEAILQRHTTREPFSRRIPATVLAELELAARVEGAYARPLHGRDTRRLLRRGARTDQKLKLDQPYVSELRMWTGSNATPDLGVPAGNLAPSRPLSATLRSCAN